MISNELLKQKILDKAFLGLLTYQDKNDTPVIETLKIINDKRNDLIRKKKLKKDKKIILDKPNVNLPIGWEWVRLGDLGIYKKGPFGSSLTKNMFVPDGPQSIKVYEQKNAIQKNWKLGNYYISNEKFNTMKSFFVEPGDIIVSCAGTIGETYVIPDDARIGIINQALMKIKLFDEKMIDYYLYYFDHVLKKESREKGKGTAISNIPPFDVLKNIYIPIPPIEEQKRIVDKIEELFSLIDRKENNDNEKEKLKLLLKDKILDEAIHGRIVKNDLTLKPINIEEIKANIPFDIPTNWKWGYFKDIATIVRGGSPRPIKDYLTTNEEGINWIKIGDTTKNSYYINNTKEKIIPEGIKKSRFVKSGSLLLSNSMSFGRPYILNIDGCIHDGWLNINSINNTYDNLYIVYLLSSQYFYKIMSEKSSGAVVSNLNIDKVKKMMIPLPPLEEQKRIVEKIENLFALIDKL